MVNPTTEQAFFRKNRQMFLKPIKAIQGFPHGSHVKLSSGFYNDIVASNHLNQSHALDYTAQLLCLTEQDIAKWTGEKNASVIASRVKDITGFELGCLRSYKDFLFINENKRDLAAKLDEIIQGKISITPDISHQNHTMTRLQRGFAMALQNPEQFGLTATISFKDAAQNPVFLERLAKYLETDHTVLPRP